MTGVLILAAILLSDYLWRGAEVKIEKLKNAFLESHGEDSESLLSCARLAEVHEVDDWARIVLDKIASPAALRSVEENQKAFESGWRENLELARKGKISADVLRPMCFGRGTSGRRLTCDSIRGWSSVITRNWSTCCSTWCVKFYSGSTCRVVMN